MVEAEIITPIRYSSWMSNLVVVQKKSGDIRLCMDFRNLNQLSLKDNYPLPNMEHLLQRVTGVYNDVNVGWFFGYNQVLVRKNIDLTFMYLRMPFGLMNVGSTF
jgi:hypothetical protein